MTASMSWQALKTHSIQSVEGLEAKVAGAILALSSVEVRPGANTSIYPCVPKAAPKHPSMESSAAKDHVVVRFTPWCMMVHAGNAKDTV